MAGRHRAPRPGPAFGPALAIREFRGLLVAYLASLLGDQLARIALAVLVYQRSGSSLFTATTYAVSYLPWLVGGPLLSGLGDRFPPRRVLLVSDLARAVVVGAMALPGVPLPLLLVLMLAVGCGEPPFDSARAAMLPEVLGEDAYAAGHALQSTAGRLASLLGFGVGGALVGVVGARTGLAIDAGTFALSAVVTLLWVTHRAPAGASARLLQKGRGPNGWQVVRARPAAVFALALASTVAFFDVIALALAVPWAVEMGGGSTAAGVLSAAAPLGGLVGGLVLLRRLSPDGRRRGLPWLAAFALAPQVLVLARPGLTVAVLLIAVAGVGSLSSIIANQIFVLAIPAEHRAKAFGVAGACLMSVQGLGALLAGLVADHVRPSTAIGGAGVLGLVCVALLSTRAGVLAPAPPVAAEPTTIDAAPAPADDDRVLDLTLLERPAVPV